MSSNFNSKNLAKYIVLGYLLINFFYTSRGQNPILNENLLTGTAQSLWDAEDNGPIEGFAQDFSVNKGETVHFKINVKSATLLPYTVKIYRLGWYQGNGARLITDLGNSLTGKLQPACNYETATGKVDCNNWAVSTQWTVPSTAVSGVYLARLDCPGLNANSIFLFIVRDDAANSPVLFKTSDATWQAYSTWGGNSLYVTGSIPIPGFTQATKVSYQRVLNLRGDKSHFFNAEYPMLRWLEKNGYNVSYTTDMDMARDATVITPNNHKILLSVGHDEYWSLEQRNKFENARANGVHIAFFSGNEVYWKTRWEDNYQTLVCYKEGAMGELYCGKKCDPLPNVWTGLWRDGCAPTYASNDGCNPEGSLSGQMSWTQSTGSIKVPDTFKNLRFWKNTTIASLGAGQTAIFPYGTLGNEWDPEQFTETYPAHRIVLSNTVQEGFTHKMSLYKYSSGALVFAAGTMQWPWGLDDKHDLNTATAPVQPVSIDMQQATVNLLYDMGVTAGSLQANLVAPTIGPDALAPVTTITSPLHNSTVPETSITITGISTDKGTGAVGGVEVSIDNGTTWKTATGLENWACTFSSTGYGVTTVKARAWDDLGNVETAGSPGSQNCINITLTGPLLTSVFNSSYPQSLSSLYLYKGNPVELGMKFRSSIAGNVTGFRYYKGAGVTGVHKGHLWSNTGTLLAEATFTNETASGWQTVTLATPVAIAINTTYIVSYFSASGDFTKTDPFFTTSISNGFLRGLANGEDGGNGVYKYSASPSFPNNTYGTGNYFADVIFASNDLTPPSVEGNTPANSASGISLSINPTATFNETLNPASVSSSTVVMTGPGNAVVPGTVTLTGGSVITFTPNAELTANSNYTITLKGGITDPVIKDLIGNALTTNNSWSFTTGGLLMLTVTVNPVSTSACSNSSVSLISAATGTPSPSVQWQKSINNGSTWTNISGATAAIFTFTAVYTDNNNQYRAVWTNSQGQGISLASILTVSGPISGSIGAVNSNVCTGAPMELQLTSASGPSPYTLQINSTTYSGITVGQSFRAFLSNETIWPSSTVPQILAQPDNSAVELGVKFQTNKKGLIKGVRFYKGSTANGGTHKGSLWSQSGTLLASATFVNETASGWQEVLFASPVEVTANTTYVASYFAPLGNYSKNETYFSTSYFNGNSLTALENEEEQTNSVYKYASQSAFPVNNYGNPNYWVDVLFAAYTTTTTTFNLTTITTGNGCSLNGNPVSATTITVGGTVNAGTVSGLSTLCVGATTTYTSDGSSGGTWSSTNTAVATVNQTSGLVTAVGVGASNITYSISGCNTTLSTSKFLNVSANANAGTVSGASTLCIGATATYTSNGSTGGTWSSTNTAVATVNVSGLVTALTLGATNITYTVNSTCGGTVSSFKTVSISAAANAGTVSGVSTLCIGSTASFTSDDGASGGVWSSSNTSVATVNASGLVTALTLGTTNITYTVNSTCGGTVSSFKTIAVISSANAGTVSGSSTLCIGSTATFTSDGNAGGVWSSSNTSVATVNGSGLVTGLTLGTTNISYTVSTTCGGPVSSFKTIAVISSATAGTVSGSSTLCIGSTASYTSDGTSGGVWSSSNTSVATVNTSGLVNALTSGTTNITYTVSSSCSGPVSSFKALTVTSTPNAGTVSGSSPLCIGSAATYTSNGNAGGEWSSSNMAVATVNASGLVTAIAMGTANITYTVSSTCGSPASSLKTLTVNPTANAGTVSGVSSLCVGTTASFTSDGNKGGVWNSSNIAVATVNSNSGIVSGIAAGTAVITYSVSTCGNSSATKSITVNKSPTLSASNISVSTSLNNCSASVAFGSNVTATSTTPVTLVYKIGSTVITSPGTFSRGTTTVTVVATNSCGSTTRTFTITVNDNQNPLVTCKPNTTRTTTSSRYTVSGSEFDASASDNCSISSLIYSLSGATKVSFSNSNKTLNAVKLNIGTTTITWRATDINGNRSTCVSTVIVSAINSRFTSFDTSSKFSKSIGVEPVNQLQAAGLKVIVMPNPAVDHFNVELKSSSNSKIQIMVYDVAGRLVEQKLDIPANSTIQFGNKYKNGIFIAEILQNNEKFILRLIKSK